MRKLFTVTAAFLLAGSAQAAWYEGSSKHFVVYANDSEANVRRMTDRLERFDQAIRKLRNVPEDNRGPNARVTIYYLSDVSTLQSMTGIGNAAGLYEARIGGALAFVPQSAPSQDGLTPQQVLLHEYSHHFMYADWPPAAWPHWFIEGFAEFQSTAIFREDGSVIFGAAPPARRYGVGRSDVLPLSMMLKPPVGRLSDDEEYVLYSRAWLFTDYLEMDAARRKQLADYITSLLQQKTPAEAAKVFGDPDRLDNVISTFGNQRVLPSLIVAADRINVGEIKVRPLGAGEAAIMPALLASKVGVTDRTAPRVVDNARRLAAAYPNDPTVQNELAEAEYDAKNYDASEVASARAIAADPKSVHALVYAGMARQAVAVKDKSKDPGVWAEIRKFYLTANKADPENAWPLQAYYESFRPADQKPSKNAEDGVLYAAALAPAVVETRLLAAYIYLQRNDAAAAREQLVPMVAGGEGAEKFAQRIREDIALLDKEGTAATLAKIDKDREDAKKEAEKKKKGE